MNTTSTKKHGSQKQPTSAARRSIPSPWLRPPPPQLARWTQRYGASVEKTVKRGAQALQIAGGWSVWSRFMLFGGGVFTISTDLYNGIFRGCFKMCFVCVMGMVQQSKKTKPSSSFHLRWFNTLRVMLLAIQHQFLGKDGKEVPRNRYGHPLNQNLFSQPTLNSIELHTQIP